MKFFFQAFILLLCVACAKKERNNVVVKDRIHGLSIKISTDTLSIKINENLLSDYDVFSICDNQFMAGYNNVRHTLDFFDIKNLRFIRTVNLDSEGPNGIQRIAALDFVSFDSIFLLSENFIYLLDSIGDVTRKVGINGNGHQDVYSSYSFFVENNNIFKYNSTSNSLTMAIVSHSVPRTNQKYFSENNSIVAQYFLTNDSIGLYPIGYSQPYRENFLGFNCLKYFNLIDENRMCFLFSGDPAIYVYNASNLSTTQFNVKSDLPNMKIVSSNWNGGQSFDAGLTHYIKSCTFGPIFEIKDFYIRLYRSALPEGVTDLRSLAPKKKFISVYNQQFELINEFPIEIASLDWERSFVIEDELYIPLQNQDEDLLMLVKITIHE